MEARRPFHLGFKLEETTVSNPSLLTKTSGKPPSCHFWIPHAVDKAEKTPGLAEVQLESIQRGCAHPHVPGEDTWCAAFHFQFQFQVLVLKVPRCGKPSPQGSHCRNPSGVCWNKLRSRWKVPPPDPWGSDTEYLNKSISLATFIFSYKKYASKYFLQDFFLFSPLFLGSFFLPKPTVHHSQWLK